MGGLIVLSFISEAKAAEFNARDRIREWVISHAEAPFPTLAPEENDLARNLVDRLVTSNLAKMEEMGLLRAELELSPWSDSYWPTYAGQIANRYSDPDYNAGLIWADNERYLLGVLGRGDSDLWSPAEKYDRLIGDRNFTLSRRMIHAGSEFADDKGKLPLWFGLCHGWAPASFMLNRPAQGVRVIGADGDWIHFRPSDIKALATLLWASAPAPTRYIGGRCEKNEEDREGLGTDPNCRDTNPATWHISAVNQLGIAKRSLVMDASKGNEVWNHPLYSYQYGYMNPITRNPEEKLENARVRLSDYTEDKFAGRRDPRARYIVNIVMSVDYITETSAMMENSDEPKNDAHKKTIFRYDLELNDENEIVGGEWHGVVHPDFLWLPVKGGRAWSEGDRWLDRNGDRREWSGRQPIATEWRRAALYAAGLDQPLARIVERLLVISRERSGERSAEPAGRF